MARGICKVCYGDTDKKHQLCEKCRKLCSRCRKQPRAPHQCYCLACAAARKTQVNRKGRPCRVCGTAMPIGSYQRTCEPCKSLCSHCHKQPRWNNRHQCRDCINGYQKYYMALSEGDQDYVEKRKRRFRVVQAIRRGEEQREPCLICGAEPTFIFVKRAKISKNLIHFFLCREHHDNFSGKNGNRPW